jgi:site-specific DNA recombinase
VEYFKEFLSRNKYTYANGCGQLSRKDGTNEVLLGYYVDEGLTASKSDINNRRAFNQMIKDAKAKKFSIIYVKSISRFSRSTETTLKLIKDLKELGIGVYFDDLKMNSLDGQNEMLITMFASVAQEDSRQKSENIHFGIMRGIKEGKWTSAAPYGYDKIDGYLKINEFEAENIKKIYDWYLYDGVGINIIAKRLTKMEIPTKLGYRKKEEDRCKWNIATIKSILNNPICTGKMIQNKTRKIDINRGIVKFNSKNDYIVHPLEELRIIDDETFRLVQIEKDERMKKLGTYEHLTRTRETEDGVTYQKVRTQVTGREGRHSARHLFSNLFYCGNCGAAMRRRKNYFMRAKNKDIDMDSLEYHYVCSTYDLKGKANCKHRNMIYESKLMEWVKKEIMERQGADLSGYLSDLIENKYDTENNSINVSRIESEISELEQDKNGLIRMQMRELINEDEYKIQYNELLKQIDTKKIELEKEKQIFAEIDKVKENYDSFMDTLKNIQPDNFTNQQLRKIMSRIRITYDESEFMRDIVGNPYMDITWRFMDTFEDDIIDESVSRWNKMYYESLTEEERKIEDAKFAEFAKVMHEKYFDTDNPE